jgi:hypothetical protein
VKVFDRYLGHDVTLPDVVEPGRYQLLKPVTLNGERVLESGDLLLSDGRERCVLDDEVRQFSNSTRHGDDESTAALIRRSVQVIAQRYRAAPSEPLSPLISSDLADSVRLNPLDDELSRAFKHGHLEEIARKPRSAMKYDAEVTQIHRVRRMAPRAVERLAGHSEDWHRRTFSGVLPGKLLALLSDDDWSIYENKVYARLLDHLSDYLRRRLAEVRKIHDAYIEAERLKDGGDLYFKLSHRLYELWGKAMDTSAMARGLKESGEAIEFLQSAKLRIGMLQRSELYQNVPRSAYVPAQLRNTNILMHDQHYRHLRALWRQHQLCSGEKEASPQEVFGANRQALADFASYLRMMLQRVMSSMRLVDVSTDANVMTFSFAQTPGRISLADDEIRIRHGERELVIVPALTERTSVSEVKPDASGCIVIACQPAGKHPDMQGSARNERNCVINPFEFYGEERLRLIVERFLWFPLYRDYGLEVGPLPGHALDWLRNHACGVVRANHWRLDAPLCTEDKGALHAWLKDAPLNDETRKKITRSIARLDTLCTCRHCGRPAKFAPRERDFAASCGNCAATWGIYNREGTRVARMRPDSEDDANFERLGSWLVEFEVTARN